jgi:predicted acetyltransferase
MTSMRELEQREKKEARRLWEEIFPEDSPAFLDAYEEVRRDNRISVVEEGDKILSMIHWNPFELCYGKIGGAENRTRAYYIVGVATREESRRRGYMRDLLVRGMKELRRDSLPFTFLMPADEAIYEPFGFRTVYEQSTWIGTGGLAAEAVCAEEADVSKLAKTAEKILKETRDVYCVRDEEYFRRLIREMASEGGRVAWLGSPEEPEGYYCFWPGETSEVREIVSREPEKAAAGLGLSPSRNRPKIMARMLDMEAFVRPLRSDRYREILIHMEDPILVENSGDFRLIVDKIGGTLEQLAGDEVLQAASLDERREEIVSLTPELMTEWMFGRIELPWGEGIRRPKRILLNEAV